MKTKLSIFFLILSSSILYGQENKKQTWSLQGGYDIMKPMDEQYGSDIYSVSVIDEFHVSPKFFLGGGVGVGLSDVAVFHIGVVDEDHLREQTSVLKFFGRAKYKFNNAPSGMFLNFDLGYALCLVDDYYGNSFNPLGFYFSPSVGARFPLISNSDLFFGAGLSIQKVKIDTQLIGAPMESTGTAGYVLYIGVSF